MKKIEFELEPFQKWMQSYFAEHQQAPDISEHKISNGAPFNKSVVLRNFPSYADACAACGIPSRSEKSDSLKKQLLEDLRKQVYQQRTTDRDKLRESGLKHDRSRYERLFGTWSNALLKAGVGPSQRYLLNYFAEYQGEEPLSYLQEKLGENGMWTQKQKQLIERMQECKGNAKEFRNRTNYNLIKKQFGYLSLIQIAAGYEPEGVFLKGNYRAIDGHECDSKEEMFLDNWLHKHGFPHEVHVRYPRTRMTCDFAVGDILLEYAGFAGTNLKSYRKKIERKIKYAQDNELKLIILYDLRKQTLAHLQAALSKAESETDIELTGNPLELSLRTRTSNRYEGYSQPL